MENRNIPTLLVLHRKQAPEWKVIGLLAAGTVLVGAGSVYWAAHRAATALCDDCRNPGRLVTTITASGSVNPVVMSRLGTYVLHDETLTATTTPSHQGQLCAKIDPTLSGHRG